MKREFVVSMDVPNEISVATATEAIIYALGCWPKSNDAYDTNSAQERMFDDISVRVVPDFKPR